MIIIGVFVVLIIILFLWAMGTYNGLIRLRNQLDEAWSGIDVQLKRRYDLIPNIVETVKGYAQHERETLERVVQARAAAMGAGDVAAQAKAENMLSQALKSLFAVAEAYPDLKANINFLELQQTLSKIEEELQLARRFFNAVTRDFNNKCETVPSNIVAGMFGFKKRDFFEIDEAERENVKVDFTNK